MTIRCRRRRRRDPPVGSRSALLSRRFAFVRQLASAAVPSANSYNYPLKHSNDTVLYCAFPQDGPPSGSLELAACQTWRFSPKTNAPRRSESVSYLCRNGRSENLDWRRVLVVFFRCASACLPLFCSRARRERVTKPFPFPITFPCSSGRPPVVCPPAKATM